MTGVDCEALRVLLAKATPGPWIGGPDPNGSPHDAVIGIDGAPIDYVAVCQARDMPLIVAMHAALPALLAKSAEYDALVARVEALAAKWDRHSADNYGDRGNSLSGCADGIRLLVSDDRTSHTAGDGNG